MSFILSPLLCLILLVTAAASTSAQDGRQRITLQPPEKKFVNYRIPARQYDEMNLNGWRVFIEKPLLQRNPKLANKALARLDRKLQQALAILPQEAGGDLRSLSLYLMIGPQARGGGRDNGLEFFQQDAPDFHAELDPLWRNCVVVYCAYNYSDQSEFWALKALVHEFSHAHFAHRWRSDNPDLYDCWEHAMQLGLYHNVKDDQGKNVPKFPACTS